MQPLHRVKQYFDIKFILAWSSLSSQILILCFNEEQRNNKLWKEMYVFNTTEKYLWTLTEKETVIELELLHALGEIDSFYWIYSVYSKMFCISILNEKKNRYSESYSVSVCE